MAKVRPTEHPPLSDSEAEEYANRFEASGPADFRPRRGGRPPLGADFPSPRIQVRVSRMAYIALVDRANEEGTTLSKLVRRLLEHASKAQQA
jgi:hypothetical protein